MITKTLSNFLPSINSSTPKFNFRTFFLKGLDARTLGLQQRLQFQQIIQDSQAPPSFQSLDVPAHRLSSSIYVYNQYEAIRKINQWKKKISWIHPFYAIKSNPISCLVSDLVSQGSGLDVASAAEIRVALDNGVSPKDIVYSNSVKEESDILQAVRNNVNLTTADTIEELEKIAKIAPQMKILWRISIKEDPSQNLATVFSGKFGDDIGSIEDAKSRFEQISKLGIKLAGIHFHCGSGKNGSNGFDRAINLAKDCIRVGRNYGHSMEILDLGGGFPSGELSEQQVQSLKATRYDPLGYKVMAEPGRHFSSLSCYLMMRVIGKRVKYGRTCYHVNESLYHSFNAILMDGMTFEKEKNQFYAALDQNSKHIPMNDFEQKDSSIFGMTCDGHDVIVKDIRVPQEIQVGDWLVFSGMGSYTYGPKSEFNGMKSTERIVSWNGNLEEKEEEVQNNSQGRVFRKDLHEESNVVIQHEQSNENFAFRTQA